MSCSILSAIEKAAAVILLWMVRSRCQSPLTAWIRKPPVGENTGRCKAEWKILWRIRHLCRIGAVTELHLMLITATG